MPPEKNSPPPGCLAPTLLRAASILLSFALLLSAGSCGGPADIADGEVTEEPPVEEVPPPVLEEEDWQQQMSEMEEMPTPPPAPPAAERQRPGTSPDNGDFLPLYATPSNPAFANIEQAFKSARILESIATDLNQNIAMPRNVTLTLRECGRVNAMYEPREQRISMCYEFVDYVGKLFARSVSTEQQAAQGMSSTMYFVFYHEIAHALVDVLKLPATGGGEDIADQLSVYVLINGGEQGEQMAFNAALFWLILEKQNKLAGAGDAPWDEHLTHGQRFYNIICLLYGSNPTKYSRLVPQTLPENRAAQCPGDYERFVKAWNHVLAPHIKQQ
ncbi:MAG TPA: DUF4344 domain-containing metallopeptidase [Pyrinomonadaceae bacterium]|nr:DUF4344 domain-containing metallopeptidase [Pyrinomonadaceae bacterium]